MSETHPSMQIPPDQEDEYEYEDDFFEETPSELANMSRIPVASNNRNNVSRRSNVSSVTESSTEGGGGGVSRRSTKVRNHYTVSFCSLICAR